MIYCAYVSLGSAQNTDRTEHEGGDGWMNTEHEKGILLMRANSTVKGLRLEHLLQGCFAGEEKFWILVRFGEECERIEAGESLAEAYELFVRFCDGELL